MGFLANLLVKIGVDTRDLNAGMDKASRAVNKFGQDIENVGRRMAVGITLPIAGLGAAALKASADMEALKMGLTAITHSSSETEKQIARLKEVAKIPGLDFQGAVKGSINLQAAGFSAQMAERALKSFGNALATVGKGREDLEGVNLVLTQILNKPKVMAQDLNQLRERLPQISMAMKSAFGSNVSEDIQALGITGEQFVAKIIAEFEKLPPVTSGLKNSFENLRDNAFQALAKIGDGLAPLAQRVINDLLTPMATKIKEAAEAFGKLPKPVQDTAIGVTVAAAVFPLLTIAMGATITNSIAIVSAFAKMVPAISKGAAALELWVAGMGRASTSWGVMVATGIFRVATWTALAVEVIRLANAHWELAKAREAAAEAGKTQEQKLLELEVSLKRQGADISGIQKQYSQGGLSLTQYLQKLRDVAIQLGKNTSEEKKHSVALYDINKGLQSFGLQTMAERKKNLEDARTLYAAVVKEYGAGSVIAQQALEKVNQAQAALIPTLEQVKQKSEGLFAFGSKGIESAILVEGIKQATHAQQQYIAEVVKAGGLSKYNAEQAEKEAEAYRLLGAPPVVDGLGKLASGLKDIVDAALPIDPQIQRINEALERLGVANKLSNMDKLREDFEVLGGQIEKGVVSVDTYIRAWVNLVKAMDAAGEAISPEARREVIELEKQYGGQIKETRKEMGALGREGERVFHAISRGIASSIVNFKGWGETFKNIAKDTAQSLLTIFVEKFFKEMAKQLAGLLANSKGVLGSIGRWLGGLAGTGGSAASAAGGAASAAGSAGSAGAGAAGSAASGVMGTIGAVSAAVGAVSSIVGNFQMAGMNKSLDVLVNHTLRIFNELFQFRADAWTREQHWYARTSDMWQTLLDIKDAIGAGGSTGGRGGITFNNCNFTGSPDQIANAIFTKAQLAGAI